MPFEGEIILRDFDNETFFFVIWNGRFWFPLMVGDTTPIFQTEDQAVDWIMK
jgi:hypothetical protein